LTKGSFEAAMRFTGSGPGFFVFTENPGGKIPRLMIKKDATAKRGAKELKSVS